MPPQEPCRHNSRPKAKLLLAGTIAGQSKVIAYLEWPLWPLHIWFGFAKPISLASRLPGDEKVPVAAALELVATATSATSATSLVVVAVGAVGAVGGAVGAAVVVSTVSTEELVAEVVLVMSGRA